MICPYCDHEATPRGVHAHLADEHADEVRVVSTATRRSYDIVCPVCGDGYSQPIKPRMLDPAFLEEFGREIRLVAFDMLVNHMLAEHGEPDIATDTGTDTGSSDAVSPDPRSPGGDHDPGP